MTSRHLVVAIFCLFLASGLSQAGEVREWENPGRNPSGLGFRAIDSLSVSEGVKEEWKQLVEQNVYQRVWVENGTRFSQMSFGGARKWTKFEVWGETVCAWKDRDSLEATKFTAVIDSLPDSLGFFSRYQYDLYHFKVCENLAWIATRFEMFRPKVSEPAVVLSETFVPAPLPEPQERCLGLDLESFTSSGFVGHYGYLSQGGRANLFCCKLPQLALSAKLMYSGQPPYVPDPRLDLRQGVSFNPLYSSENYKLGLRVITHLLETEILYGYIGWQRYDYDWKYGYTGELEFIFHYCRYQGEQIVVLSPAVNYLWERSRLKYNYLYKEATKYRFGVEWFYEGDDYLRNPGYYYTRGGILWEIFRPFSQKYWYAFAVHGGYGTFGMYAGLEFNLSAKVSLK